MSFDQNMIAVAVASCILVLFLLGGIISARRSASSLAAQLVAKGEALSSANSRADEVDGKLKSLEERFSQIIDAGKEAHAIIVKANVAKDLIQMEADALAKKNAAEQSKVESLRASYQAKKATFDALVAQLAIYDERLSFAELGIYEPHFDFDTSEKFKAAIEDAREDQKRMVTNKTAVVCDKNWTVDGSAAKGKVMTDRNIRLTLRAFNSECDAAISNVRWNNANAMEKRVTNARVQIDKANASNSVTISDRYLYLKLKELRLTHEQKEKIKQEREERSEMARAAREEQKLLREMEEAEREEAKYQKLLEKAQKEAAGAVGAKQDQLLEQVDLLSAQLAEAHAKVERAQAMAERTKTGYVYIISNIGSFGPDFVKIGLTRRLDPVDRVRELGDASVPFFFDTHAIIYSEDAPALERALHSEFAKTRVNATNFRKEFFRCSLDEVETAVAKLAPQATFFKDIEAQEYHETLALRKQALEGEIAAEKAMFPASI